MEINSGTKSSKALATTKNFTLRKMCQYSELFWSAFSCIRTEYGEIRSISPYSVQMRENGDQNNSEYGHFVAVLLSEMLSYFYKKYIYEIKMLSPHRQDVILWCVSNQQEAVIYRCFRKVVSEYFVKPRRFSNETLLRSCFFIFSKFFRLDFL